MYEAFRMNGFAMDYISEWKPETHKYHIDLWAANRMQLLDFGVPGEQIETSGICTYMRHEEFSRQDGWGLNQDVYYREL